MGDEQRVLLAGAFALLVKTGHAKARSSLMRASFCSYDQGDPAGAGPRLDDLICRKLRNQIVSYQASGFQPERQWVCFGPAQYSC